MPQATLPPRHDQAGRPALNARADAVPRGADLVGRGGAELDVLLVQRNAVEHRLYALARPTPALMRLDNCAGGAHAARVGAVPGAAGCVCGRERGGGRGLSSMRAARHGAWSRTDVVARDRLLEVHVVQYVLLELLDLGHGCPAPRTPRPACSWLQERLNLKPGGRQTANVEMAFEL